MPSVKAYFDINTGRLSPTSQQLHEDFVTLLHAMLLKPENDIVIFSFGYKNAEIKNLLRATNLTEVEIEKIKIYDKDACEKNSIAFIREDLKSPSKASHAIVTLDEKPIDSLKDEIQKTLETYKPLSPELPIACGISTPCDYKQINEAVKSVHQKKFFDPFSLNLNNIEAVPFLPKGLKETVLKHKQGQEKQREEELRKNEPVLPEDNVDTLELEQALRMLSDPPQIPGPPLPLGEQQNSREEQRPRTHSVYCWGRDEDFAPSALDCDRERSSTFYCEGQADDFAPPDGKNYKDPSFSAYCSFFQAPQLDSPVMVLKPKEGMRKTTTTLTI